MGCFETILELSGKEMMPFLQESAGNISNSTYIMLVAAVDCYNDKYGKEPADREKIRKIVKTDGELKHFNELIALYSDFINPSEPGEVLRTEPMNEMKKAKSSHGKRYVK